MSKDSNVINMFKNHEPIKADESLEEAKGKFQDVLIVGYDQEGRRNFFSNGNLTWAEVSYMLSVFLNDIHSGKIAEYDDDE